MPENHLKTIMTINNITTIIFSSPSLDKYITHEIIYFFNYVYYIFIKKIYIYEYNVELSIIDAVT